MTTKTKAVPHDPEAEALEVLDEQVENALAATAADDEDEDDEGEDLDAAEDGDDIEDKLMPSDWTGNDEETLAQRLIDAEIIEGMTEDEVAEWLDKALKADERVAITTYVRHIEWLDEDQTRLAKLSTVTVPDILAPKALEWTRDPMTTFGSDRVLVEAPAAIEAPVVVESGGQIALVTEPEKPRDLKPMTFRSGEEVGAVRRALEDQVKEYEKLAKETEAIGETSAAKILRDKAALIKTQLIPQVTAQQNLPFNERETLPGMVARTVSGETRSRVRAALMKDLSIRKGETKDDAQKRQLEKLDDLESLIGNIGEHVAAIAIKFITAAAERGLAAGRQALQAEPGAIAREAMQLVEFNLQQGRTQA